MVDIYLFLSKIDKALLKKGGVKMPWYVWVIEALCLFIALLILGRLREEYFHEITRIGLEDYNELFSSDFKDLFEKIFKKVSSDWSRLAAAAKNLGWEYSCEADKSFCKIVCKTGKGDGEIVFVFHAKKNISNPFIYYKKMEAIQPKEAIEKLLYALL
jgi:hypothetical protein